MRNYKRKTDRQSWSTTDMALAIKMMVLKKHGLKKVASRFNVPSTTLQNRVKKYQAGCSLEEACKKGLGKFRAIFSEQQEAQLVKAVMEMSYSSSEVTIKDLRRIAYQLAEKNNIHHKFNVEDGMAGQDWATGFMRRHPELSFLKHKPTYNDTSYHLSCVEVILHENNNN